MKTGDTVKFKLGSKVRYIGLCCSTEGVYHIPPGGLKNIFIVREPNPKELEVYGPNFIFLADEEGSTFLGGYNSDALEVMG